MVNQDGLEWVSKLFYIEPTWAKDPDLNAITRLARQHLPGLRDRTTPLNITFYAQGTFSKVYAITSPEIEQKYIMRVSLPIDPHYKVSGEVATIKYIREQTTVPIPDIVAWDADNRNELGFEWMLMDMCDGTPIRKKWRKMTWEKKEAVIRQLARFQAELFGKRFEGIGNIYFSPSEPMFTGLLHRQPAISQTSFDISRIVSMDFFLGDLIKYDIPRGPFKTSYDWLHTRLQLDEIKEAEAAKEVANQLLDLLPALFPPTNSLSSEPTVLFHDDMSSHNILVTDAGDLTAVIDWEFVSTLPLPLWRACQFPRLLEGRIREAKPLKENYSPDDNEDDQEDPYYLDNEGVSDLYWIAMEEYEVGVMRKLFLEEMRRLQPDWVLVMEDEKNRVKADFERAVGGLDQSLTRAEIRKWLDSVKDGKPLDLQAALNS
ncbi:kinase-like protein [Byssothecium circinans]|uniref:Kinase-like protein n=1 Tax=Byssothecium circinans TaxID=147558 RepID=A0A6A5UI18_9PLEO|nr:kinase-like protein [Byssothecium circinans]